VLCIALLLSLNRTVLQQNISGFEKVITTHHPLMQRSWHEDFWRTVLHNDVRVIVMLEDGDNGSTVSFT